MPQEMYRAEFLAYALKIIKREGGLSDEYQNAIYQELSSRLDEYFKLKLKDMLNDPRKSAVDVANVLKEWVESAECTAYRSPEPVPGDAVRRGAVAGGVAAAIALGGLGMWMGSGRRSAAQKGEDAVMNAAQKGEDAVKDAA